jgi:hypothetical protein
VIHRPVLYPTLVAVAFVVSLYFGAGIHIASATRTIVFALILGLSLTVIASLLMGDRCRGGMIALLVVLCLVLDSPLATVVLGLLAIALIAERLLAKGAAPGRTWLLATRVLDGVSLVLGVTLVLQFGSTGEASSFLADLTEAPQGTTRSIPAGPRPADIYVLLLDGHLRSDRLAELFGSDTTAFMDGLQARGFDVSPGSRSNYLRTEESLPTMLNGRHLPELIAAHGPAPRTRAGFGELIRGLINRADGVAKLRESGYEIDAVSSGFEQTSIRSADRFIDTGEVNEFEYAVLRVTAIGSLLETIAPEFLADQQRSRVVHAFDAAAALAREPSARPRFVWVHVPSPHFPAVFGRDQNPPPPDLATFYDDSASGNHLDRATFGRRYADQVTVVDQLALRAIDDVLSASTQPPTILVLSDHGSGSGLNWSDLAHSDLDERTANFFAAYTPGHPNLFGTAPTLINTLPTLLAAYTGSRMDRQPDTLYEPLDDYGNVEEIDPARIRRP